MIKLYGNPMSRSPRNQWMLNECGVAYEVVTVDQRKGEQHAEWFSAINPNCKVPALQDGDVTLCESMAINLYIARKYGGELFPTDLADQGRAFQWSVWAVTELEPPLFVILLQVAFRDDATRDTAALGKARTDLQKPLSVLEKTLSERAFLASDRFSVADLNVASVLAMNLVARVDLDAYPHVRAWFDASIARPANRIAGSPFSPKV